MARIVKKSFSFDHKETDEYKYHRQALARFQEMSHEEKLQTFIDAGILSEEGKLTKRYGGSAPNSRRKKR